MTTFEMKNYKKSLKIAIKSYDLKNDIIMRNQKINQLLDVSTDCEKTRLPKWYFSI